MPVTDAVGPTEGACRGVESKALDPNLPSTLTENSNGYQTAYIRLPARFDK